MEPIRHAIYWVLGEVGHVLTDESLERYLDQHEAEHKMSPGDLSQSFPAGVDVHLRVLLEQLRRDWERYDSRNPAMRAVVLRLEQATVLSVWSGQTVAVRALGRLAIRCGDPVRLHIYEFLSFFNEAPEYSLQGIVAPFVAILDAIYLATKEFARVYTPAEGDPARASSADLLRLLDDFNEITAAVTVFCEVGPAWLPLGEASKSFLSRAWEIKRDSAR